MTTEARKWGGSSATRARTYTIRRDKGICYLCGHTGANSLEHIIPKSVAPELMYEPSNWTITHLASAGHAQGCQHPGCACVGNIARGTTPIEVVRAVVQQLVCTCPCTCGGKSDHPHPTDPTTPGEVFTGRKTRTPESPTIQRMILEEQRYPNDEAARAAAAYRKGDRTEWARVGYNVHLRRQQRARRGAPIDTVPSRTW